MGKPGDRNWKDFVGPASRWDVQAAHQFTLLVKHGLRGHHRLCDVGCGSLRAGRLFIPYLDLGCYYGIEPEDWLVREGLARFVGDMRDYRIPQFITERRDFPLQDFGVQFDYVLAQSIFSHADPNQVKLCLRNAAKCLAPGGQILANWAEGKDFTGEGWQYPRSVFYSTSFMHTTGKACGLKLVTTQHETLDLKGQWGIWRK